MKKIISILMAMVMVLLLCGCSAAAEQAGNRIVDAAVEQIALITARILEAALAVAFAWLIRKAGQTVMLKNTEKALQILQEIVIQTVGELQQMYVKEWKIAGGGKLSPQQIQRIREELFDLVYTKLSEPTAKLIEATGADLRALIQGYAEKYLNDQKNGFYIWPGLIPEEVEETAIPEEPEPEDSD